MYILGLYDGHDSGACIVKDGVVLRAVNEERLSRKKFHIGFPYLSIEFLLRDLKLRKKDITHIAIGGLSGVVVKDVEDPTGGFGSGIGRVYSELSFLDFALRQRFIRHIHIASNLGLRKRNLLSTLKRLGFHQPVEFVEHHKSHAYSAYYTFGKHPAWVFTVDGTGDYISATVYAPNNANALSSPDNLDRNNPIHRIASTLTYDSPGYFYSEITHLLGFKMLRHEGKITGLAALGDPDKLYDQLKPALGLSKDKTEFRNRFKAVGMRAIRKMRKLTQNHEAKDIAAAAQYILEETVVEHIAHMLRGEKKVDVALAGGTFANVKLNQRVHELSNINTLFIHPHMGDGGLNVGAALYVWSERAAKEGKAPKPKLMDHAYLGPEYNDKEIKAAIDRAGLKAHLNKNVEKEIAGYIADGKVVARFNGRMEYGPRALGNRSILYSAKESSVNQWLNRRLKRTEFMPFAPSTLYEYKDHCYKNVAGAEHAAEFMTITFDCTPWTKKNCPAIVHVDGTARPQLVKKEINPSYYKIIDEYRKITGSPTIVNTSFNMHEEPIVCTPDDAIRSYLQGHLDVIALGNWIITNPKAHKNE
ncbi:MAG: carbamoyltransferase C-terminal domain-containing protein [Nanoarchaeota archaeon]